MVRYTSEFIPVIVDSLGTVSSEGSWDRYLFLSIRYTIRKKAACWLVHKHAEIGSFSNQKCAWCAHESKPPRRGQQLHIPQVLRQLPVNAFHVKIAVSSCGESVPYMIFTGNKEGFHEWFFFCFFLLLGEVEHIAGLMF